MWRKAENPMLTVLGLRKGLSVIGLGRSLANAIVDHLERNNRKIEKGDPIGGYSPNLMK
jgi:hypothetical protein